MQSKSWGILPEDVQNNVMAFLPLSSFYLVSKQFNDFFKSRTINLLHYMKNVVKSVSIIEKNGSKFLELLFNEDNLDSNKIKEIENTITANFKKGQCQYLWYDRCQDMWAELTEDSKSLNGYFLSLFYYKLQHQLANQQILAPWFFEDNVIRLEAKEHKYAIYKIDPTKLILALEFIQGLGITTTLADIKIKSIIVFESLKDGIKSISIKQ